MSVIERLSCEEKNAMKELEMRVKNVLPPNFQRDFSIFYRFLKARDFNVDKAEILLRKNIEWRKTHQIDTIVEDFKPRKVFLKLYEPTMLGYDKEGDIVMYSPVGKIEARDIFKCMKMNELLTSITWVVEKLLASLEIHNEQTGGKGFQIRLIFDLDKLTLTNTTSKSAAEFLVSLIHLAQDIFPERLKSIHLINAPGYYMIIYSIVKVVLTKAMIIKFRFFGSNGWKEDLLQLIDADILPAFLGGNRTDPDGNPMCYTFVRHGGSPSSVYYLSEGERYFEDVNLVKKVVIPPSKKKEVHVQVTESGARIQWKFFVRSKEIGFGLSFQISEDRLEELLSVERYSTPDGTEEGFYKCQRAGTYVITFDNSFSWLIAKEIEYCVEVLYGE